MSNKVKDINLKGTDYGIKQTADALAKVIELFKTGDVPRALANAFLIDGNLPMASWSASNRFLAMIQGATDARNATAWKRVGRYPKEKCSIRILKPFFVKKRADGDDEEEEQILVGFKGHAVFDISQTDGRELPEYEAARKAIEGFPLLEVAKHFGLEVVAEATQLVGAAGYINQGQQKIAVGVSNLATWAHELIHAAEYNMGVKMVGGQDPVQEIVAELGGAVLLLVLGYDVEADLGGAYKYVTSYAEKMNTTAEKAAIDLSSRVTKAVEHILAAREAAVAA